MRLLPPVTILALVVAGLMLGAPPPGSATVALQEQASGLGYPADDCSYCHSFSKDHMTRHAREAGLQSTNCITCHGDSLPLAGVDLYNERGNYLLEVKKQRKAKRADMSWLADYVPEKSHDEGESKPPDSDGQAGDRP